MSVRANKLRKLNINKIRTLHPITGRSILIFGKSHLDYLDNYIPDSIRPDIIKDYKKSLIPKKQFEEILRDNRIVYSKGRNYITQSLPIELDYDLSFEDNLDKNEIIEEFDEKLEDLLLVANKELFKNKNILNASVRMLYMASREEDEEENTEQIYIKNTEYVPFRKDKVIIPNPTTDNSDFHYIFIGYSIKYLFMPGKIMGENSIMKLKAYHPSSNRKYHDKTHKSTTNGKICIFETFMHITNQIIIKRKTKKHTKTINKKLSEETKEIKENIEKGLLFPSLKSLTEKYKKKVLVWYYTSEVSKDAKQVYYDGRDNPVIVDNGNIEIVKDYEKLREFEGKEVFLYEENVHVAPMIFKIPDVKTKAKKGQPFTLRVETLKKKPKEINNILSFKIDYKLDKNNNKMPVKINLYGCVNKKKINESFENVPDFVEKLNEISTPIYTSKTRPKNEIPYIWLYGFENNKNDNIYIYKELFRNDPNTEYSFNKNTIKHIKYRNIYIHDLSLFYGQSLKKVYKNFDLKETKNECEMIYNIGTKHLSFCLGEINGKYYNLSKCPTISSVSKKIYVQCFLEEFNEKGKKNYLQGSKEVILKKERESYYGGKNEVYKKKFESKKKGDYLHYYDINSAHADSMKGLMPYKFLDVFEIDETLYKYENVADYYLYLAKSEYTGNDKNFIPNIMTRDGLTVNCYKNSNYNYYWGCEIKEAMLNNCDVHVKEIVVYEPKEIFDNFIDYYYNAKTKAKKEGNGPMYQFYKNILTNLYGKFAQKNYSSSMMINSDNQLYGILDGSIHNLINQKHMNEKETDEGNDVSIIEYKSKETNNNNIGSLVRLSAYTSARTRCTLSKMMREIGHKHIYYCATDSIFTDAPINKKYINKYKLGAWSIESTTIDKAYFIGCGTYYYNDVKKGSTNKCKAFNKEDVFEKDYIDLCKGKKKNIKKNKEICFRDENKVHVKNQVRKLRINYNKRIFKGNKSTAYNNINDCKTQLQ